MPIVVDPSTPVAFVVPDAAAVVVDGVVRIDLGAAVSGVTTLLQTVASTAVCVTNLSWMER